jgi:DNA topoisomerase-1
MAKSLLIVESPTKARTLTRYLGPDFEVAASVGHIRDLPVNRLGVDIEHDFAPEYETIAGKQKIIAALKKKAQGKDVIYLGPDPDREGEAIAWHIAETLKGKDRVFRRVLFHELTPAAIRQAIAHPEDVSIKRFESQQARRVLDRLVGYQISPLLWNRVKRGLSAGRVQSVALRIIAEREREIFAFRPEEYWTLTARLRPEAEGASEADVFAARLHRADGKKIEPKTGDEAGAVVKELEGAAFVVAEVAAAERQRHSPPPFTTSQLQQEAFARLRFPTARTMSVAQQLYEGVDLGPEGAVGLITYMRTDSVRVAAEAVEAARQYVRSEFGPAYLPDRANAYRNRKDAQDAHEAVRPTSVERTPQKVKAHLSPQQFALYDLIWRRFVASQMKPAVIDQTTVDIQAGRFLFRATGSITRFDGFLKVYGRNEKETREVLPALAQGDRLSLLGLEPKQHFTQPPPRFTEATLVKELESNGIGRPSTYAAIISTIKGKEYVSSEKGQLSPTELGLLVSDLLVENFPRILNVQFTADMEDDLDEIEEGRTDWREILKRFYAPFQGDLAEAEKKMLSLKRDGIKTEVACGLCGAPMVLKFGRNGPFLSCSRYPECSNARDYVRDEQGRIRLVEPEPAETQGACEKCGRPMVVKKGRYGSFLACSGYPECKNARPLNGEEAGALPPLPPGVEKTCPACGAPFEVRRSQKGNLFIACGGYPKCRSARPFPTGVPCPKPGCDGQLVERSSARGRFFGCSNYPKCRFTVPSRPVGRACPRCGSPFLIEAAEGREGPPMLKCPTKDCDYQEAGPESRAG